MKCFALLYSAEACSVEVSVTDDDDDDDGTCGDTGGVRLSRARRRAGDGSRGDRPSKSLSSESVNKPPSWRLPSPSLMPFNGLVLGRSRGLCSSASVCHHNQRDTKGRGG